MKPQSLKYGYEMATAGKPACEFSKHTISVIALKQAQSELPESTRQYPSRY